jgi:NAD+ kinase
MLELKKVGLLLRDEEQEYPLEEVHKIFGGQGIALVLLDQAADSPDNMDLVMAMGGDGTVLQALDHFPQCPVLAINFGTVGFLTAADRKDLEHIVALLVQGKFLISERLVLDCEYPGGTRRVVNEAIVRTYNRLVYTDVFVDDTKIRTIRADGVVVGTPTGSTAHLLAMGAPIVMPDVRCMILDGINEYNLTSRALILPPESHICLHISPETRDPHVYLTIDGRQVGSLSPGQDVHIRQSPHTAKLIYFEANYFFHNLSSKLAW